FLAQYTVAKVFLYELGNPKQCTHCLSFFHSHILEASIAKCTRNSSFSFGQNHQRHATASSCYTMKEPSATDSFIICMRENNEHTLKLSHLLHIFQGN